MWFDFYNYCCSIKKSLLENTHNINIENTVYVAWNIVFIPFLGRFVLWNTRTPLIRACHNLAMLTLISASLLKITHNLFRDRTCNIAHVIYIKITASKWLFCKCTMMVLLKHDFTVMEKCSSDVWFLVCERKQNRCLKTGVSFLTGSCSAIVPDAECYLTIQTE